MKPLRRKKQIEVEYDPVTGLERPLEYAHENDVLSDHGSIDTVSKRRRYFCDCGCNKPAGGRCAECRALSCVECHGRCQACASPLCLEHSVFVDGPDGRRQRFCRACYERLVRRERWRKVGRFLFSPFVHFED